LFLKNGTKMMNTILWGKAGKLVMVTDPQVCGMKGLHGMYRAVSTTYWDWEMFLL
jgi:hypothetical protein